MRLKTQCPTCGKEAKLKYETAFGKSFIRVYLCGHTHTVAEKWVEPEEPTDLAELDNYYEALELARFENEGNRPASEIDENFFSLDGSMCAYPFQRIGVSFAEKADFRCLIADAMGLGKTIQGLTLYKRNKKALTPLLIAVKGSTMLQWCHQFKLWVDDSPFGIMPIISRENIIPGFKVYVVSIDFLGRKGVLDKLVKLNLKAIIVDECQNFKDGSALRSKALIELIERSEIHKRILLSGTPIKNRANEYFTALNLLDPSRFHSYASFCRQWLIPNDKGVYTRIDPYLVDQFREYTSKYIIRREKHEVLKNLPKLFRDYRYVEIDDPVIKGIYNNEIDLFSNFMRSAGKLNSTQILGWLAKMRAITGQAKIPWAIEYAQEFLDNTEDSLMLGIHHHSVRDALFFKFTTEGYNPLKLSGEDNIYQKDRVQNAFNEGKNRLLIINCLAGGVGLNLQKHCSDFVVLERMWNGADEEQFEARVHRDGQTKPVTGVYPIAEGTIDEWFHDMVRNKAGIVKETMGDGDRQDVETNEEFLLDLMNKTLQNKLK